MILATVVIFCIVFLALGLRVLRLSLASHTISVATLSSVRGLLSPKDIPVDSQLQSRAHPNMRLVRAFDLTNTFISPSPHVHNAFVHTARRLITSATPRSDWRAFAGTTIEAIEQDFASIATTAEFSTLIQRATLRVVLHTLFQVPLTVLDNDGIALVAYGVNELWRLSKTKEYMPQDLLPSMNTYLRTWIPDIANPLDFVIPTYETLWRVVAVTIALVHEDECALRALQEFFEAPTKAQFEQFYSDGPSVAAIIAEVMRLHPPTKRISRASTTTSGLLNHLLNKLSLNHPIDTYIADIGAVQRDSEIWGPRACAFDPMRHHPDTLTPEQRRALLGFGLGKLQCVASSWAPLAVGIISATVLAKAGDGYEIVAGPNVGGREGWEGWTVRRI